MSSKLDLKRPQQALPRAGSLKALAISALIVALCALAKPPLDQLAGVTLPPFITLYPSVVLASMIGGVRIGLLAAIATATIGAYFWLPAYSATYPASAASAITVGLYVLITSFLAWVVGVARAVLDSASVNEEERNMAARESVHRIKNLLAVIQAIARKIGAETDSLPEYQKILQARLAALDVAQGVLVRRDWTDANLSEIVEGTLAPFLANPRLVVTPGPKTLVPAQYVSGLCMALYELCTNGLKYGALAPDGGHASLQWRHESGDAVLEWREIVNSAQTSPERSGFGSMLIRTALANAQNTKVDYRIGEKEIVAIFQWPAANTATV